MNKKNIWIINEYAGTPEIGMEYRHYYLGKEFLKLGHNVTIVSASYSHLFKNPPTKHKNDFEGLKYLWLKVPNYKSSHNRLRVLKWFIFTFKLFFLRLQLNKPDVILLSPMAPFAIFPSYFNAKISGAILIYEVKDIWPLSLIKLGGFSRNHPLIRLMRFAEQFAIKKADKIVSNLPKYENHLIQNLNINKPVSWISNGVDLNELTNSTPLDDCVIASLTCDKFVIGYTGTIGTANAMESFFEASKLLKNDDRFKFVIVGDGKDKDGFITCYGQQKNIVFIDSVPKTSIQAVLSYFDVCFLGWNKEELYEFGTSANKLFDYMYSGKLVLNAYSGKGDIVEIADCGTTVEAENSEAILCGIKYLYGLSSEDQTRLGKNGKKYIEDNFTYNALASNYNKLFK